LRAELVEAYFDRLRAHLLHNFAYRSRHGHYLRRRGEWLTPLPWPTTALWWAKSDVRPIPAEAVARLQYLRRYGPSPQAFTVRHRYGSAGRPERAAAATPAG
jgi:Domain of unknown function (DUF3291)